MVMVVVVVGDGGGDVEVHVHVHVVYNLELDAVPAPQWLVRPLPHFSEHSPTSSHCARNAVPHLRLIK